MKTLKELLIELHACEEALDWADDKKIEQVVEQCHRGDWLLWLAHRVDIGLQPLTLAKGHCANTVRHLMKDKRSINGVDAAIAFGEGKASIKDYIAALKAGLRSAVAKKATQTIAKNADDFELGMRNALDLTPQMRVPPTPLKLTPNQMIPGSSKIVPFPKNTKLTTEDQNESSKGNTEMSINPFIKGFFDIEEARAKNTNIFDESKKLTAAQKKNLDKNDNDKIDAEDFKMLRKEEAIEEAKTKPGHNAMVMAKNMEIIKSAIKAATSKNEETQIDEADFKLGGGASWGEHEANHSEMADLHREMAEKHRKLGGRFNLAAAKEHSLAADAQRFNN